jgi:hypothetical protein
MMAGMNPLVLLFMAIATFLLAVIAFAATAAIALTDNELGNGLAYAVLTAGGIGVAVFGLAAVVGFMSPPTRK